jgi:hypothetical protein
MGWVIFYYGCPVLACSKLQGMVALSTTEAEYTALSTSLHDVIPIMELRKETREIRGTRLFIPSLTFTSRF